ncbi:MAG TPA: TetR/AcrR family transcriptional regulator [Leptospiraceae bacterium]|nr:TetR/AcrR family transcriptional regulator [Leptospirales bacterium]HMX55460.1 TetR/AcrR family transcriptional regulator [Leptospiraceae bacterium]HNJ02780.1 TetR/AcrR family transcriptional regulator [Leptospiraceae bacterium]HNL00338.1 TetR/AcrR family transcriptional regulator [Leptospiraceae bacterium]
MKDKILERVRLMFFARGFAKMTSDEIASGAGVSKRTLYKYYPEKDRLIESVMESVREDLGALFAQELAKKEIDPMDRFRAIVLGITAYGSRFSKIFMSDLQKVRPDEVQKMIAFRTERLRSLGSLLREGQKAGVVRKGLDANLSVEILLAAMNGVMTPEFLAGGKYSFATAADGIFELFFRGVLEPGAVRVQKQRYRKVNNRAN